MVRGVGEKIRLEAVLAARVRLTPRLHRADESVEFCAIGPRIALQKEIENLVADKTLGPGELDRRLADVAGLKHALGAVRLDPLVVAVSSAARIRDLGDLARFRLHDDDGGVDVAGFAYRLVDKR